jgi:hypothetical protein
MMNSSLHIIAAGKKDYYEWYYPPPSCWGEEKSSGWMRWTIWAERFHLQI